MPQDLLSLSTPRALARLAWPLVVLGLLRTGTLLVDSWFVGFLGTDALAALAGCAFAWWIVGTVTELSGTGTQTLVAQAVGARRGEAELRRIGGQGVWVALLVALGVLLTRPAEGLYFDALALHDAARHHGVAYLDASLLGAVTLLVQGALVGVYRGLGDTRAAMAVSGLALVANAALDPLFMFVLDGGIAGAAWATVVANGLGALAALIDLARRGLAPAPAPDLDGIRRIAAIGAPLAAQGTAFSLVYVFLGRVLAPFGAAPLAALGLGHRLESLPYLFCLAFEMGVATLVGQHLGAGDPEAARRAGHAAARFSMAAMLPFGVALFLLAGPAFRLFTDDPSIVAAGSAYLRVQAVVWWAMAAESVYTGAFAGAGRTVPPLVINGVLSALRVPLAYFLAEPLGADGVWLAIGSSTFLKGVVLTGWWTFAPMTRPTRDTVAA